MFGLPAVHTYTQQWFGYYFCHIFPYITPWVYPVGMIAQTGSVYLTICVTIERYVAVCLPLKARYLCTFGRAKIYVAGVGFGAVLYNLPRIWEGNQNEISIYLKWILKKKLVFSFFSDLGDPIHPRIGGQCHHCQTHRIETTCHLHSSLHHLVLFGGHVHCSL